MFCCLSRTEYGYQLVKLRARRFARACRGQSTAAVLPYPVAPSFAYLHRRVLLGNMLNDFLGATVLHVFCTLQVSKSTGRIKWSEVTSLEKGGVFTHGSIEELRRLKGEKQGRQLYGDGPTRGRLAPSWIIWLL